MANKNKLIEELAEAASMTPEDFKAVVKQRCFKDGVASDAQLFLLLTIAHKYDLNPLAREIHAFINEKRGNAMEIAIGLDGWIKIATRNEQFDGYEARPILNDQGVLTGIDMRMHRKDWKYPGSYTAWMDEWMVASQSGKPKSNWEQYPRHRLFAKAFQECARFTFGITEVVDTDDVERIERTVESEDVIYQPAPAEPKAEPYMQPPVGTPSPEEDPRRRHMQPKALEHTPAMPMANFRNGDQVPQPSPETQRPQASSERTQESVSMKGVRDTTSSAGPNGGNAEAAGIRPPANQTCQHAACPEFAAGGPYKTKAGDFYLCETHRAQHEVKPRGRPRKADGGAAVGERAKEGVESGGGLTGASETPPSTPAPAAAVADDGTLESFIAAHSVPKKRLDLALAKYGAGSIGELKPDEQTAILDVFKRSYANA